MAEGAGAVQAGRQKRGSARQKESGGMAEGAGAVQAGRQRGSARQKESGGR